MKRKIFTFVLGVAGLVLAYLLASAVSKHYYAQPDTKAKEQTVESTKDQSLEQAKPAMTEEEINAMLSDMRLDETAEASATEQFAEERQDMDSIQQEINPIKFEELREMNPDVYAWITIPGTDIDYPILQHASDNSYYLKHNIDGSYGYPGCIYTENLNSKDFTDNNTVIYGHNMKNGSMFAGLHQYEARDFFDENREVIIYLPDQILHYTIFAAYTYDDRHLLYSFDFSDTDIYEAYLQAIFDIRDMNANIDKDMTVTGENKIITLVTCIGNKPENRLLVQAVLQEPENG